MREIKKKKKYKSSVLLRIALFCLAAYVLATMISQQVQISQKKEQLSNLQGQIRVQEIQNDEIRHSLKAGKTESGEYAQRLARKELDYAKPGERVFVIVSGE